MYFFGGYNLGRWLDVGGGGLFWCVVVVEGIDGFGGWPMESKDERKVCFTSSMSLWLNPSRLK